MTAAERLREEGRQEGFQEGFQEGRQEGRQESIKQALLRQLQRRFGEQPSALVERVEAASPEQLDPWIDRIVTAASLEQVFGE